MKELKPITDRPEEYEKIERAIIQLFRSRIYLPIFKKFGVRTKSIKNSLPDLLEAIRSGRITYNKGVFSGNFNSTVSKELRALGAKFDRSERVYRISKQVLPVEVLNEISASFSKFREKIAEADKILAGVVPEELAKELRVENYFDSIIYKTDRDIVKTLDAITIKPQLTEKQRKQVADEWQNNMDLWIKDFTEKEIKKLRSEMQKSVFAGNRFGAAVQSIKDSYGVSERKAKFLASQETRLLTTKLKEIRYVDAGVTKYKWKSVTGTPAHPVRPMHQALNDRSAKGEIFDFRNPPVTNPEGQRNNPGQDWNCLLEDSVINLAYGITRIFKRPYVGKLATIITHKGRKFTATPNHPILTLNGWKSIQSLNAFDDIVCVKQEVLDSVKNNNQSSKSTIGEIFASIRKPSFSLNVKGESAQFHGDGSAGNVNVIGTNRSLSIGIKFSVFENLKKFFLSNSYFLYSFFSAFKMKIIKPFLSFFTAKYFFYSNVSLIGNMFPLSRIFKSNQICLGTIPNSNSVFNQSNANRIPTYFQSIRDGFFTFSRFIRRNYSFGIKINSIRGPSSNSCISTNASTAKDFRNVIRMSADDPSTLTQSLSAFYETDSIANLIFSDFNGHVYNLETTSHWYIGEGNLCQMNCRCSAIPVITF